MKVNFEITGNYAVTYNDELFDLHNEFDFEGYESDISSKTISLFWKTVKSKSASSIQVTIFHRQVSFSNFQLNENKDISVLTDSKCLGDISFMPSDDREINSEFYVRSKPDGFNDILYVFESGDFIRIGCGEVDFSISKSL